MIDGKPRNIRQRAGLRTRHRLAELKDIHSKVRGNAVHNIECKTITAVIHDRAIYNEHTAIYETIEDHIVPRNSVTVKQLLRVKPPVLETETVHCRQLDHSTGKMVETTDQRLVYRSDRTLLNGKAFQGARGYYRQGSVSVGLNGRKTVIFEPEISPESVVLGPASPDPLYPAVEVFSPANEKP